MVSITARFLPVLGLIAALWAPAAAVGEAPLPRVVRVTDGATLVLDRPARSDADSPRLVRLAGLDVPPVAVAGPPEARRWPLAERARDALSELALGHRLRVAAGGRDRYGRLRAQATRDDGLWLQGEMLRQGWARVRPLAEDAGKVAEMLALEAQARAAGRGLWAHPLYAPRTPETVADDVDSFQIVRGRVVDAAQVGNTVYLNFGPDWRTDFTIRLPARARSGLAKAGLDVLALKGREVMVRGWVAWRNGPEILVTHPGQMAVPD